LAWFQIFRGKHVAWAERQVPQDNNVAPRRSSKLKAAYRYYL
jgi:hypothetical protein